jgi:hypothetical protein
LLPLEGKYFGNRFTHNLLKVLGSSLFKLWSSYGLVLFDKTVRYKNSQKYKKSYNLFILILILYSYAGVMTW